MRMPNPVEMVNIAPIYSCEAAPTNFCSDYYGSSSPCGLDTTSGNKRVTCFCEPGTFGSQSSFKRICTGCGTVAGSSARTCNASGASGIQTVTCNTSFHESGSAGNNLGCTRTACASGSYINIGTGTTGATCSTCATF